jgi:hypothetical protein
MAMATIDKTSIREELDRFKQEFEKLCSDDRVSPEIRAVMNSLLVVVELILAIFLGVCRIMLFAPTQNKKHEVGVSC